jgi:hypothetical protein
MLIVVVGAVLDPRLVVGAVLFRGNAMFQISFVRRCSYSGAKLKSCVSV